jgi:hypothetical protein
MEWKEVFYATGIVILILIIILYVRYYLPTWTAFTVNAAGNLAIVPTNGDISTVRFRNCIFTVVYNGTTYTANVTNNLNSYVKSFAYKSELQKNITTINLDSGLNPFSFVIPQFQAALKTAGINPGDLCQNGPVTCNFDSDCTVGSYSKCKKDLVSIQEKCPDNMPTTINATVKGVNYTITRPNALTSPPTALTITPALSVPDTTFLCTNSGIIPDWAVTGACSICTLKSGITVTLTGSYKFF